MKNALLLCCFAACSLSLNAQLSDGEIAPDWTLTDIFGNTHHLYDYLDQGKTVVIDFSATWCGPCWNYHNTGYMENFWEEHGPGGDGQTMVFFIEGDMATTLDDLYGLTDQSQGDWVAGTGYSIFNPTVYDVVGAYAISYFPTIYKICPNKQIYEVGQVSDQIFENWIQSCTMEADLVSTMGTVCFGAGQGMADIDASGGFGSIYYAWSNGNNTQDLTGVEAGIYKVTVSEGMGRKIIIDEIEIEGPEEPIEVSNYEIADLQCFQDGTGSISVEGVGGNGGFSYNWSNGSTGSSLQAVQAGTYTVTLTDSQGCTHSESFEIFQPELLESSVETVNDHCYQLQGEAIVIPEGGTGPYVLESSGGSVFPGSYEIHGLAEGSYTITLTDAHGCSLTSDLEIVNVPGPDVVMPAVPEVTCLSGPAVISPFVINDAEADLEFSWSTADGQIISGGNDLVCTVGAPGEYTLFVEDLNYGCDLEVSITIEGNIDGPEIDGGADLAVTCEQQTVQANATVVAGGVLVYNWSTSNGEIISGGTTLTPVFGTPGTYTLTVLNTENGCSSTDQVVVADNRELPVSAFTFSAEDLSVNLAGGPSSGEYHWDFGDGTTSSDVNAQHTYAIGGTYHVCLTVTNACGSAESCKDILVQSGNSVILVELSIGNISCYQAADGALSVQAFGGSGTYTFEWVTPSGEILTGDAISDLPAGTYILTVSDDAGNQTQVQATITEPSEIQTLTQQIPMGGINGPGIDLDVQGGTQGYTYQWNNGATTQDIYRLGTGSYQCTITDANGCTRVTDPIRVVNLKDITIRPPGDIVHVLGNPRDNPLTVIIDSEVDALHAVRVFDVLGRPHLMEEFSGTSGTVDLRTYGAGIYFLAVYEGSELLKTVRIVLND